MLPEDFEPHVSFMNPCQLCLDGEGEADSLAHVGHNSDRALDPIEEIVYSLSGGAAEIACGLNPVQLQFPYGGFPQSMGTDLSNLEAEMEAMGVPWDVLGPALPSAFELICQSFQPHRDRLVSLAGRLLSEGELQAINSPLTLLNRQQVLDRLTEQQKINQDRQDKPG